MYINDSFYEFVKESLYTKCIIQITKYCRLSYFINSMDQLMITYQIRSCESKNPIKESKLQLHKYIKNDILKQSYGNKEYVFFLYPIELDKPNYILRIKKIMREVKTSSLSLRMVTNRQEHTWGRSLDVKDEKCRIECFGSFISDLSRVCPIMITPTHHYGPALARIISP